MRGQREPVGLQLGGRPAWDLPPQVRAQEEGGFARSLPQPDLEKPAPSAPGRAIAGFLDASPSESPQDGGPGAMGSGRLPGALLATAGPVSVPHRGREGRPDPDPWAAGRISWAAGTNLCPALPPSTKQGRRDREHFAQSRGWLVRQ